MGTYPGAPATVTRPQVARVKKRKAAGQAVAGHLHARLPEQGVASSLWPGLAFSRRPLRRLPCRRRSAAPLLGPRPRRGRPALRGASGGAASGLRLSPFGRAAGSPCAPVLPGLRPLSRSPVGSVALPAPPPLSAPGYAGAAAFGLASVGPPHGGAAGAPLRRGLSKQPPRPPWAQGMEFRRCGGGGGETAQPDGCAPAMM